MCHHHLLGEADDNLPSVTWVESVTLNADAMPDVHEEEGCPILPTYCEEELQHHQRSDRVISPVVKFLEVGDKANPSLNPDSLELKLLLKEWK